MRAVLARMREVLRGPASVQAPAWVGPRAASAWSVIDRGVVDADGIRVDSGILGAVQLARTDTPCRAGGMGGARPR